jgi:hypothetical protein
VGRIRAWWSKLSLRDRAVVAGVAMAALGFVAFMDQADTTRTLAWQDDPVGLVIVPGLLGSALEGVVVSAGLYAIFYVIGRLRRRSA